VAVLGWLGEGDRQQSCGPAVWLFWGGWPNVRQQSQGHPCSAALCREVKAIGDDARVATRQSQRGQATDGDCVQVPKPLRCHEAKPKVTAYTSGKATEVP